jgi:Family of unknown function (DUF695)/Regulator of ribonuclease activity B
MKLYYLLTIALLSIVKLNAQQDAWNVYLADYDGKPGSTVLNMSIVNRAPVKNLPYLIVTGLNPKEIEDSGFPTPDEFTTQYAFTDSLDSLIVKLTPNAMVGMFTSNGERLHYIYVADTIGLRNKLINFYADNYPTYTYYLSIKKDAEWKAYLEFLYPNDYILEYMGNESVIDNLIKNADKLDQAREVTFWAYFKTKGDRANFITYIKANGFSVEEEDKDKNFDLQYTLRFSKTMAMDLTKLTDTTFELRKKATENNGEYDGWETVVVK